jgi:hypothetical protein
MFACLEQASLSLEISLFSRKRLFAKAEKNHDLLAMSNKRRPN